MAEPKNLFEYICSELEQMGETWDDVLEPIWIGKHGWDAEGRQNKKISKEEARKLFLKDPPGSDYGGEECWEFHIYTKKHILFKATYDGMEWIESIPRSPQRKREVRGIGG